MAPPMLRFAGGPADAELCGWSGSWPPPEELLCMVGKQTGLKSWTEVEIIDRVGIDRLEVLANCHVFRYLRETFSMLPAEVDEHPHVLRGAQYRFDRELVAL